MWVPGAAAYLSSCRDIVIIKLVNNTEADISIQLKKKKRKNHLAWRASVKTTTLRPLTMEDRRESKMDQLQSVGDENSKPSATTVPNAKEQRLIRKMDLHILPFVVLLYLFSFLDRGTSSPHLDSSMVNRDSQSTLETPDCTDWRRIWAWLETNTKSLCPFYSSHTAYVSPS